MAEAAADRPEGLLTDLKRARILFAGTFGGVALAILGLLFLALVVARAWPSGPGFFVQILIYGVADGAIYALVALGYTMVYGIIELINFAHGDIFTTGSVVALACFSVFGLHEGHELGALGWVFLIAAFPIAMIVIGSINMGIERVAYRPLRNAPKLAPLITAIGMSFLVEGVLLLLIGDSTVHYPDLLPGTAIPLGHHARITVKDISVMALAAVLVILLSIFITRTRLGKAMRATAQDRDAAHLMGIDINRTISATFFIGGALAAAGGTMYGLYYNDINYQLGFSAGLFAFTAAVLGGIGNIQGAALGGMLIGLIRAFSDVFLFGSQWTDVLIFSLLVLILLFRPTGLLGMRVPEK
jgi:branched-chain amino acid transport system permease protein